MSGFGISTICFGGSEWHSVQKDSQLAVSINWVSFWLGAPRIRALLFGVYIRASFGNSQMRGPYQPRHLTISSQAVGLMEESCSSPLSQLARDSLSGGVCADLHTVALALKSEGTSGSWMRPSYQVYGNCAKNQGGRV